MLLDPKEDVQLQPPVMETDSKVDDGNYCMVYSATILTSAIFKIDYLYTTPWYLLLVFCCKHEAAGSPKIVIVLPSL